MFVSLGVNVVRTYILSSVCCGIVLTTVSIAGLVVVGCRGWGYTTQPHQASILPSIHPHHSLCVPVLVAEVDTNPS